MGFSILFIFILCGIYVQNRGLVQHGKLVRKITDHSNIMAPINCLFYAFSSIKNTAYINAEKFPELKVFQENWEVIRDEAIALNNASQVKSSEKYDDLGFNSFFRTGWKRFYLKWYGASLNSANQLCPKTTELLNSVPNVKGAMFTMLPPGATLVKHRDPYAGSLRYHLGLVTPNSEDCYIDVDGKKYWWKDGEAVMFDETFIHYANNQSDSNRIVLFIDVKRPVNFFLVDWVNTLFSKIILSATATKNMEGDKVGLLNRVFPYIYNVRKLGKKIKLFNRKLYYILQYSIYAAIIYAIVS
ncbi:aspartyl/asparaginyl beta-hydroxylase domain-containing protein [Aliikangiella coralliicola]|uniref:Aspartyl/asparaginyl beta-hydroxylase domain-containing protein n=1 Tax=Aliikangiella coralliicola TaxID=2592383 RepID=A0A545UCQ2_9GAMM|nr:aspartyl/asparaginyl beta-hydroxylase domain-containing protein [Aliikangiella coralliicola]TQV87249.1 aspartyl/asparaginyl beta-hydroxylase domain-containing protein [Aliikangiella coralliicola]